MQSHLIKFERSQSKQSHLLGIST